MPPGLFYAAIVGATVLLGLAALLAFCRLTLGPSLPDRVLSLDLISNLTVGGTALYAIAVNEPLYLRAAIVMALLSFLGTVAFAYFVDKRGRP